MEGAGHGPCPSIRPGRGIMSLPGETSRRPIYLDHRDRRWFCEVLGETTKHGQIHVAGATEGCPEA
jgi:hypothetical protein